MSSDVICVFRIHCEFDIQYNAVHNDSVSMTVKHGVVAMSLCIVKAIKMCSMDGGLEPNARTRPGPALVTQPS